jgi:hypothetical protein
MTLRQFTLTVMAGIFAVTFVELSKAEDNLQDCHATYSEDGKLYIPCVDVLGLFDIGIQIYEVDMAPISLEEPFHFKVTGAVQKRSEEFESNVAFTVISEGTQSDGDSSGTRVDEFFEVIRNEAQFISLWEEFTSGLGTSAIPEKPRVDFDQEMVIMLSLGIQPNGGYHVKVKKITESKDYITVTVRVETPNPNGSYTDALIRPYQFVKLKSTPKIVVFNISKGLDSSKD